MTRPSAELDKPDVDGQGDEPYDAGNPQHVKAKQQRSDALAKLRLDGLRYVMATKEGRAWMWSMLDFCGPFRTSYVPDSDRTLFNEGQSNIGKWILAQLRRHCLSEYTLMEKENG